MPAAVGSSSIRRAVLYGILLCFFLSGAAGLVYQVAWGKALGLIFGHTVYAIATVLAVFMGGLALGSAWVGRWSERHADPVALYGWIELGVAATGALSLVGLAGVRSFYIITYHTVAGSTAALLVLRFAGAAIVLFLPTFLMGGTLPVLVRGLARSSAELGARISRLYWVNTAGAVVGTLAAGFVLLPAMGLRRTVAAAVALNVLAGTLALLLSRSISGVVTATPEGVRKAREQSVPAEPQQFSTLLLVGFAVVGAAAMTYEISWTRLLATGRQLDVCIHSDASHVPRRHCAGQRAVRVVARTRARGAPRHLCPDADADGAGRAALSRFLPAIAARGAAAAARHA